MNSTRPLLVGSIVVAVVATLLAIAVGFATNVLSVLVDQQWVRGHRGLVLAGFGTVAAVSIFVAAVQARRAHQAAAPAPQAQTPTGQQLRQSTSISHSQVGAIVTIETAHGPITVGAPPAPIPPPTPPVAAGTSNLLPPNPDFTGRRQLLDRLWRALASGPTAVVAAHGLGGIGKTQLALEYAHQHRDRGDYDLVWWVPAETPLSVAASLTLLAPVLGLAVAADQEATVAAVLAELGRRERWLLVFDNAEYPQHLRHYLPPGRDGHVLVTSRNPAWSGIARPLDVDVLSPDEAIELLTGSSGDADRQAAAQVAEALGWLPLALAQAAAYTQQIPGLGLAGYLDRYHHAHAELLARSQPIDYPATVAHHLAAQPLPGR